MQKIPVILAIDVEPDERLVDRGNPAPWTGYERAFAFFSRLRPVLHKATDTNPRFCWFYRLDPQIAAVYGSSGWPLRHYSDYISDFLDHGDELGIHAHTYRWDNKLEGWITDFGDQAWVDKCVTTSLAAYRQTLGTHCRAFRFGDGWLNHQTVALLEKLGVEYDLTLEPGSEPRLALKLNEHHTGCRPDYRNIPRSPYHPLRVDYSRPDPDHRKGIRMIPLSTAKREGLFNMAHNLAYRFVYCCSAQPVSRLSLRSPPPVFRYVMEKCLVTHDKPYLVLIVRTEGVDKFRRHRRMERNLRYFIRHPFVKRFVFTTPGHALELLEIR